MPTENGRPSVCLRHFITKIQKASSYEYMIVQFETKKNRGVEVKNKYVILIKTFLIQVYVFNTKYTAGKQ
jgi:hypothetical protein